ncbi:hypothetical protein LCGC14_1370710, partial [marine sediment metagenome]
GEVVQPLEPAEAELAHLPDSLWVVHLYP